MQDRLHGASRSELAAEAAATTAPSNTAAAAAAAARPAVTSSILDGEIVAFDEDADIKARRVQVDRQGAMLLVWVLHFVHAHMFLTVQCTGCEREVAGGQCCGKRRQG